MSRVDLEKDVLADNATSAFAGALLMAQTWRPSAKDYELPFVDVTIPGFGDVWTTIIVAPLVIIAFILAVASIFGWSWGHALLRVSPIALVLSGLTLVAFLLSWFSVISELQAGGLLREFVSWGGLAMSAFLLVRFFKALLPFIRSRRS